MSGYNCRSKFDECDFKQASAASMGQRHYAMFNGMYENPNNTKTVYPCSHGGVFAGAQCRACQHNKDATIDNDFSSIEVRTDIESDLRIMRKSLGRCMANKYLPCPLDEKACTKHVVVNPILCDRDIVPTNMVRYQKSGI